MRNIVFVLLLLLVCIPMLLFAQSACSECHGEKDFVGEAEDGTERSLYVDEKLYQNSVHGGFECIDCHADAEGDPHEEDLEPVNCNMCHEDSWDDFAGSVHGKLFIEGNSVAPGCASCHTNHYVLSASDSISTTNAANLPNTCGICHGVGGVATKTSNRISEPVENFLKGFHGHALMDGNVEAASCNDCHESHRLLPASDPSSSIFVMNISRTCGKCHEQETEDYNSSIHGVALADGEFDAPTCHDCHGEHNTQSLVEKSGSPLAVEETCAPCHSIAKLNEKYGILSDVVTSYQNSYHGLASAGGSTVAAKCTSCHGVHNIYVQEDPRSTIHVDNLVETCGNCHPNANEAFAKSYIHENPNAAQDKIAQIVKDIYIWLIVFVIGGMIVHNLIIWVHYVRAKIKAMKVMSTIDRFDKAWVIQHVATMITFSLLVITGFALKFPNAAWVKILTAMGLTEAIRGLVHRISAVGMILATLYQFYHLLFSWKGELKSLTPNYKDIGLFFDNMKYYLGLTKERPQFERFGYVEKAEYWALIWGTVVMVITGLVLWFPTWATGLFPAWIVKVSEVVHYYEAWLATLAIVFYHMFFAIFHPEDYPINLTGFTGKIPEEEAKERFPVWYRKLKAQKDKED